MRTELARVAVALVALVPLWGAAAPAGAQQAPRVYRVGILSEISPLPQGADAYGEAFSRALRERGWSIDQTVRVESLYAEGRVERLPDLAAEFVRRPVDVIVVGGGARAALAAAAATSTIPIVLIAVSDPVRYGLAKSVARPGRNITGLSDVVDAQISPKRLQLLKELSPRISRVAVIHRTQPAPFAEFYHPLTVAAGRLGLTLLPTVLDRKEHLEDAFAAIVRERADAVLVQPSPLIWSLGGPIAELAARRRLPTVFPFREAVVAGGLMAYAVDYIDMWRRAAGFVDRVLRGANPADLPIEQPTKFGLTVNMRTARALGLTMPPALLVRADEVIE